MGHGGGYASIVHIKEGKYDKIANVEIDLTGGTSFPNKLMSWCIKEFKENNNMRNLNNPTVMKMLRRECELAKLVKLHFQNNSNSKYS